MGQAAASAILIDRLLHGRIRIEGLEQLNQVGAVANLKQGFAHLVGSQHFFAMNLAKSEHLVRLYLAVQFALPHGDGHVIDEQNSRNRSEKLSTSRLPSLPVSNLRV